jgi:Ca2+-binding RTX toxin-like protein
MAVRYLVGAAVLALGGLLSSVPAPSAAAAPGEYCHGALVTIVGTPGDDVLRGTDGDDVIAGLDGDDVLAGGAGDDVLCGGYGGDVLRGGAGDDRLFGDRNGERGGEYADDADTLIGGDGDDLLDAGADRRFRRGGAARFDTISWAGSRAPVLVDLPAGTATGQGQDTVVPPYLGAVLLTDLDDSFVGTPGRDRVAAGAGADAVATGRGSDVVDAGPGGNVVGLGPGSDRATTGDGGDEVRAGGGADRVVDAGGPGVDTLYGGPGPDLVEDRLIATRGQVLDGGPGRDRLRLGATSPRLRRGWSGRWEMSTGVLVAGPDRLRSRVAGFEEATLGRVAGRLLVRGTDADDEVRNEGYRTEFVGLAGDDVFWGSAEKETFLGNGGYDVYAGDADRRNTCLSVELDLDHACAR